MNKLLISLALASSIAAQAQTTSTSAEAAAPAAQTSTTTATEAKPEAAAQFGGTFAFENSAGVESVATKKGAAPLSSYMVLGATYKTGKMKYELSQQMYMRSNQNDLEGTEKAIFIKKSGEPQGNVVLDSQYVRATYSSEQRLLGSEPISFSGRYYIPSSETDRNLRANGIFRGDINPSWILNPKWTLDYAFSPRLNLYLEGAARGADARYRLVTGPSMTYNVSDAFNAYYTPYVDIRSFDLGRGDLTTDGGNIMYHEVGLNIMVGKLTINPAIDTNNNMNDRTASVFTEGSRVFSPDTTNYNLNFYATF